MLQKEVIVGENNVKQEIQRLINEFKENYQYYKDSSEADIETKLVESLFKILGWQKTSEPC